MAYEDEDYTSEDPTYSDPEGYEGDVGGEAAPLGGAPQEDVSTPPPEDESIPRQPAPEEEVGGEAAPLGGAPQDQSEDFQEFAPDAEAYVAPPIDEEPEPTPMDPVEQVFKDAMAFLYDRFNLNSQNPEADNSVGGYDPMSGAAMPAPKELDEMPDKATLTEGKPEDTPSGMDKAADQPNPNAPGAPEQDRSPMGFPRRVAEGVGKVASAAADLPGQFMRLLSGQGAMNPDEMRAAEAQYGSGVPQGGYNPEQAAAGGASPEDTKINTLKALEADKVDQSRYLQALQLDYWGQRAAAFGALRDDHLSAAAHIASHMNSNLPDGKTVTFKPTMNDAGITAVVTDKNGNSNKYDLTRAAFGAYLRGNAGEYNHVAHHGINGILDQLSKDPSLGRTAPAAAAGQAPAVAGKMPASVGNRSEAEIEAAKWDKQGNKILPERGPGAPMNLPAGPSNVRTLNPSREGPYDAEAQFKAAAGHGGPPVPERSTLEKIGDFFTGRTPAQAYAETQQSAIKDLTDKLNSGKGLTSADSAKIDAAWRSTPIQNALIDYAQKSVSPEQREAINNIQDKLANGRPLTVGEQRIQGYALETLLRKGAGTTPVSSERERIPGVGETKSAGPAPAAAANAEPQTPQFQPPKVNTQAAYDRLKPGTEFIAPNGRPYRKPEEPSRTGGAYDVEGRQTREGRYDIEGHQRTAVPSGGGGGGNEGGGGGRHGRGGSAGDAGRRKRQRHGS